MSWWQTRKARKNLVKAGIDMSYLKGIEKDLKQGMKQAEEIRDQMRAQESPQYGQIINTINQIIDGKAPIEQKKQISIKLVESADQIADWERKDLLAQIDSIYGK